MASIKVKFHSSSVDGKEGVLYYQLIHNRSVRKISSSCKLYPEEWDNGSSSIRISSGIPAARKEYLVSASGIVDSDIRRICAIIRIFENRSRKYTADEVVSAFRRPENNFSICGFMQEVIKQISESGKARTAETYRSALKSLTKFLEGKDIMIADMDQNLMMRYEGYLKRQGVTRNTSSFYMRILRATYNRAVERGVTEQKNPFRNVYTGVDKTVKRSVGLNAIKMIKDLDLHLKPLSELARDMFMFSFYTRGMSFVDMAYLRKSDLKCGILTYRRRKTGKLLNIKWEKCMQEIVDKYQDDSSPYMLPIIHSGKGDERQKYKNAIFRINSHLKEVGMMAGIRIPLTMYVARHSWASIAHSKNIPVSVISESMGHDDESTTRIYLASLDTSVVDRANNLILKSLR